MYLNDVLKTAAIEELRQIDIFMIDDYARKNETTLNNLYNQGIIDDNSIEEALEKAVFNYAKQEYQLMTEIRDYPSYTDHVIRPSCFAYALEKDIFSKKEIKQIPFDHGDTVETFSQRYYKTDLLSTLREELLNPIPLPKFEEDSDPHPICSCGH